METRWQSEGCELTSYEDIRITTKCWDNHQQKKCWDLPKKTSKDKVEATMRWEVGHNWHEIYYSSVSWATHKLESNYIPEVLPQEWKFSGLTGVILPWLGVWQLEEQPLKRLVLKASRNWSQEFHSTGGNRCCTLGRCTPGTRGKSSDLIKTWTRLTCWCWRLGPSSYSKVVAQQRKP